MFMYPSPEATVDAPVRYQRGSKLATIVTSNVKQARVAVRRLNCSPVLA